MDVSKDAPEELECPVTLELMVDAVLMPDGHSYSLKGITAWAEKSGKSGVFLSPITKKEMRIADAMPNINLRSLAERYQKRELAMLKAPSSSTTTAIASTPVIASQVTTANEATITVDSKVSYEQVALALDEHGKLSHQNLIQSLTDKMGVDYTEIHSGDAVERNLVKLAGITTSQTQAMFRRDPENTTRFHLNFTDNTEYQKFVAYYTTNYPMFIVKADGFQAHNNSIIHVNTKILEDIIAPVLKVQNDKGKPKEDAKCITM